MKQDIVFRSSFPEPAFHQAAVLSSYKWSIEPMYYPEPVYVRPAPVFYVPQRVYVPQPVAYAPVWVRHGHRKWRHEQAEQGY